MVGTPTITPPQSIAATALCCERVPLNYRKHPAVERVCDRCCRAYGADGRQVANWAWREVSGGFEDVRQGERVP